jgi:hypothetical protein
VLDQRDHLAHGFIESHQCRESDADRASHVVMIFSCAIIAGTADISRSAWSR